ncbi:MAG: M56 family metallopeptidase [Cyanobacteria bacterium SBLK]|nr:M56 family metallopeptidase [Cyanobacteria bacterium SBLK]
MHLFLILIAVTCAIVLRWSWRGNAEMWRDRWHAALLAFLLPPFLLLTTAIAIVCMGDRGTMIGMETGQWSYYLAIAYLIFVCGSGLKLFGDGRNSLDTIRAYPQITLQIEEKNIRARLLEDSGLYSAQIGFLQPELVVSQGLLKHLDREHLQAVLTHEQAHLYYRDTFLFFWLGWLRRITPWLPATEVLWEELLALRELRADRFACQQIDGLVLAESLLLTISTPFQEFTSLSAEFNRPCSGDRLQERVDALLTESDREIELSWIDWSGLAIALLPLIFIPLHY